MAKKFGLIIIWLVWSAFFLSACARTTTSIVSYGSEMTVTLTMRGNLDLTNNDYFMVISSQEAFQIPYDAAQPQLEFIEPGIAPTDPAMDYYPYYQTWDGYLITDNSGSGIVWLVRGPFASSSESYASYSRTQVGTVTEGTNQWTFNFTLSSLYGTAELPSNIYFDLVSVSTSTNRLQDHLTSGTYIRSYRTSTASGSDSEDGEVDDSADITAYSVSID